MIYNVEGYKTDKKLFFICFSISIVVSLIGTAVTLPYNEDCHSAFIGSTVCSSIPFYRIINSIRQKAFKYKIWVFSLEKKPKRFILGVFLTSLIGLMLILVSITALISL